MADKERPADETAPDTEQSAENICPDCGGEGEINGGPCPGCNGTGRVIVIVGDA
jgi:DnaJ-class molecular chaperone